MKTEETIFLGEQQVHNISKEVREHFVEREGDTFYRIENYKAMDPFFMTISSDANHWMFISTTGGLTAGRVNSEFSLFPYYTDDRITENAVNTGPATVMLIKNGEGKTFLWEPFTEESSRSYSVRNFISKNVRGNKVEFEEINDSLGLSFCYRWMNSREYGWVRRSVLKNMSGNEFQVKIVDGLRNIIPAGTESKVQNTFGNLLNAYKKSEIDRESGMGIFALSAKLTDLAEPSESLKANTIWSCGIDPQFYLLNDSQLKSFARGEEVSPEFENKGERGSYLIGSTLNLEGGASKTWYIAADVDKDHSAVNELRSLLLDSGFNGAEKLEEDIAAGCERLDAILVQNDGLQNSGSRMNSVHHQANVMYNIMRGGYFLTAYSISTTDLADYIETQNKNAGEKFNEKLKALGETVDYDTVQQWIEQCDDRDLSRIWLQYLPLSFSRRHGDPSRPWNIFSIETEKEDGSAKLDYQGNWRDIFQNWEALSFSYPRFIEHIISNFLNATTADGYNPYRISRSGIDWEVPEPGNPWANIGYWSDHQIIYLLKMLEMNRNFYGEEMLTRLNNRNYTFAHVPYEIKGFAEIQKDPYNTIDFNYSLHETLMNRAAEKGADGKMLHSTEGQIVLASMTEKLFILLLAKLGNYVPGGGIWMNTQRPEWNDANNALVGKGVSVVTLAYVRRYIAFLMELYSENTPENFTFDSTTAQWLTSISSVFQNIDTLTPMETLKRLGLASQEYRSSLYQSGFSGESTEIKRDSLSSFLADALKSIDETLKKNKRDDGLYHSYNTLEFAGDQLIIHKLYEMLEGQVAVLSSGFLTPAEAVDTLEALRKSALYREDQNSYMLYPDRELPGYLEKNNVDQRAVENSELLTLLIKEGNSDLITRDIKGQYHFNGNFRNVLQVEDTLNSLESKPAFSSLVEKERKYIEKLFEETFNHQSFTGRSGTFFAFEGLGSIYWHMVSKLLLAVQENIYTARNNQAPEEIINSLKELYYHVRSGIGYNKSASEYGAFPFEPYSHTPGGKGARQPGMTGQVKEEVITRLGETGIRIIDGEICLDKILVDESEFHSEPSLWTVSNCKGEKISLRLPEKSMGITFCQTPFVLRKNGFEGVIIHYSDGREEGIDGYKLSHRISRSIYNRTGEISRIEVLL